MPPWMSQAGGASSAAVLRKRDAAGGKSASRWAPPSLAHPRACAQRARPPARLSRIRGQRGANPK